MVGLYYLDNDSGTHLEFIGGNSRIWVEHTTDQFYIYDNDTNRAKISDPTDFDIFFVGSFTDDIYNLGGAHAVPLRDSYFQFYSLNSDNTNFIGFIYHGYVYDLNAVEGAGEIINSNS